MEVHKANPVKAIRDKCIDCMGGVPSYVRDCTASDCALYPFRLGANPYRKKQSEEQRSASRERMREMRRNAVEKNSKNTGIDGDM